MTDNETCCCTETLIDLGALKAAYWSTCSAYESAHRAYEAACRDRDEMAGRLTEAIAERDRARDTAARLEAELARGHRVAAPDVTLTRTSDGAPGTPDEAVPGPSGALGRPGSEIRYADAYPHKSAPESPSATGRP